MQRTLFLSALLVCSSTLYAMELTTADTSITTKITDDLFTTAICPRLDRPERDALRRTSKKYFKLLFSQDELNRKYNIPHDHPEKAYWRSMGGLLLHEEFANAVKNNKNSLATWLLEKNKVDVWDAYCRNIQEAVETLTIECMLPVIKWLLDTRKPLTHRGEFLSGYHYAINLKQQYPGVQKIIDLFIAYEKAEEARKRAANNDYHGDGNCYSWDRGPWHSAWSK